MPSASVAGASAPATSLSQIAWRERLDRPVYHVELWPNQSLTRPGLHWFLGISAGFLLMPLITAAGTLVFWGLLPFLLIALIGVWAAIRRNRRNLSLSETLWIWRDEIRVERRDPDGGCRRWQADPFNVRVRLHKDARIEDYLTLTGGGREIELGTFLSPEERVALSSEIETALTRALRG